MPDIVRTERFIESNSDAFVVLESIPYDSDGPTEIEGESVLESEDKAVMPIMPEPLLTRKAIEAAHVKRQTESERRTSETLADFFRGRIEEIARAVAKQRVKLNPDKANAQAKRIVAKSFDADEELKGLVKAIAPHMAAAFVVGAGAELELNEKAAKARSARLKGMKYDPAQPRDEGGQWTDGGGGAGGAGRTSGEEQLASQRVRAKSHVSQLIMKANPGVPVAVRENIAAAAHSVIEKMGPQAAARIRDLENITIFKDSKQLTETLAKHFPEKSEEMDKGIITAASYMQGASAIFTSSHDNQATMRGIMAHEMAHAMDGAYSEISKSKKWNSAWESEVKTTGKLTVQGQRNAAEGLAEFGRLLWASNVPIDKIKISFPKMLAVLTEERMI